MSRADKTEPAVPPDILSAAIAAEGDDSLDALLQDRFDSLFQAEPAAPLADAEPASEPVPEPALRVEVPPPEAASLALDDYGRAETYEMFGSIAALYIRPVKQFAARLKQGPLSTEWLEICLPAVGMVARSARTMGLRDLAPFLDAFEGGLKEAGANDAKVIDGGLRNGLLVAYADLENVLPQAFRLEGEGDQRESVILHSVLRQVPDVGKVTLDKIFAAGLASAEMLERATPADLARTTGIPIHLSERICARIREHGAEHRARLELGSRAEWLALVEPLVAGLEAKHEEYRRLEESQGAADGETGERRRLRRVRQETDLRITVVLAEMGELELVDEMQRLTHEGRIQRLRRFVGSLREQAAMA